MQKIFGNISNYPPRETTFDEIHRYYIVIIKCILYLIRVLIT